ISHRERKSLRGTVRRVSTFAAVLTSPTGLGPENPPASLHSGALSICSRPADCCGEAREVVKVAGKPPNRLVV
ncbi:MAG: hypothetical protein ACKVII_02920, partial [Planctomycetales bacterium]